VAPTLNALVVTTSLAGLAAVARAVGLADTAWMLADGLALMFLLVAGFAALLDVDLRVSTPRELLITALLLMLAFGVGATALLAAEPLGSPIARIAAAAPAYFGALALALLFPHLFDLRDSRLVWSWALMWLAALFQTAAYVADIGGRARIFDLLAAGLWAASWLVHLATLRQIAPDEIDWPDEPSMSEEQRLTRAVQFCYAGCYRLLRAVYGARRTTALDDRMDGRARATPKCCATPSPRSSRSPAPPSRGEPSRLPMTRCHGPSARPPAATASPTLPGRASSPARSAMCATAGCGCCARSTIF
jgi:putative peptide zinc metalloprotease protein